MALWSLLGQRPVVFAVMKWGKHTPGTRVLIPTEDGLLAPEMVEAAIQPAAGYRTPTSLVVLEQYQPAF